VPGTAEAASRTAGFMMDERVEIAGSSAPHEKRSGNPPGVARFFRRRGSANGRLNATRRLTFESRSDHCQASRRLSVTLEVECPIIQLKLCPDAAPIRSTTGTSY
jgi:hypothetical protein